MESVMASPLVSQSTIPDVGKNDTMTGIHSRLKRADFKSELERGGDRVRELLRSVLQEVLEEEMTEVLGALQSERTSGRSGYRSGYCNRFLTTRVGAQGSRVRVRP